MRDMTLRDYQSQVDSINMTLSADPNMSYDQRQALLVERDGLECEFALRKCKENIEEFLGHPV